MESAHILGMLPRICSLLYSDVKPVFVFDGKPPALKTLALVRTSSSNLISMQAFPS